MVAGVFDDWGCVGARAFGPLRLRAFEGWRHATFPARLPMVQRDYVYARGMTPLGVQVPRGRIWWRMSDHLPLVVEFGLPD